MTNPPTQNGARQAPSLRTTFHAEDEGDLDALTDLFLGESPTPRAPAARAARPRTIELLIRGHLPVHAAPWSSQYARILASQSGSRVALIRLGQSTLSVELFGEGAHPGEAETPEAGLRRAVEASCTLIVQLEEVHQAAAAADPRISAATILAGTNEAAIVAAYRTIKGLTSLMAAPATGEEHALDFRVALVSGDESSAAEALERLRRAVAVFLDRPLTLAASIGPIAPTGAQSIFRGECTMGPGRLIDLLTDTPVNISLEPGSATHAPARPSAAPPLAAASPQMLSALIPGLHPTHLHWPNDPSVEITIDGEGALHLLRSDDDHRGVERLIAASAWAERHAELLRAALHQSSDHCTTRPIAMHLVTSTPHAARALLDTPIHVHLLIPAGDARSVRLN